MIQEILERNIEQGENKGNLADSDERRTTDKNDPKTTRLASARGKTAKWIKGLDLFQICFMIVLINI